MKYHPIIFNDQMVRAILAGTKTQTRRIVKPPLHYRWLDMDVGTMVNPGGHKKHISDLVVRWKVEDRLWVRETFAHNPAEYELNVSTSIPRIPAETWYRADFANGASYNATMPWRPSIHMPRSLSRITLEVTDVRVERLERAAAKGGAA